MAQVKCSALFQLTTGLTSNNDNHRTAGWSESFYANGGASESIKTNWLEWCRRRAALMPPACTIVGQRYQQIDPVGPTQTGGVIFPGTSGLATDIPQMALFLKMPGLGVTNFRPTYIRGLPDARVVEGEYQPSLTFSQKLLQWQLQCQFFAFRAVDLATANYPLFGIANDGTFTTEGAHGLVVNDVVNVLRTLTDAGDQVGGKFRVIAPVGTNSGTLFGWNLGNTTGGRIRKKLIIYPKIDAMTFDELIGRVVTKKVGSPFAKFRGRTSKKR